MVSEVKNIGIPKDLVKDVVIRTLRSRVEEINHKLKDIHDSMNNFERRYGMKTDEFYEKICKWSTWRRHGLFRVESVERD